MDLLGSPLVGGLLELPIIEMVDWGIVLFEMNGGKL